MKRLGCLVGEALLTMALLTDSRVGQTQTLPEISLGLRGRTRSVVGVATEHMALVELAWTPRTSSRGSAIPVALTDVQSELEPAAGSEVPLDPLERDDAGIAGDEAGEPHRGRDASNKEPDPREEIPFVLTPRYARQAVEAALAAQGVAAALGRLDGLSTRARTSGMLPEIRFRAGRDVDQSLRLTPTADDPYRYSRTGGVAFVLDGSITWRLGRLAFAGEELSIERLRLAQARERQRISMLTMNELLAWQAAWRRLAAAGNRSRLAADDLAEAALRLDLLTNGWFANHPPAPHPDETLVSRRAKSSSATGVTPKKVRWVPAVAEVGGSTRSRFIGTLPGGGERRVAATAPVARVSSVVTRAAPSERPRGRARDPGTVPSVAEPTRNPGLGGTPGSSALTWLERVDLSR